MKDPGIEFLAKTTYPDFSTIDMIRRVPEPPSEQPVPEGAKVLNLPPPEKITIPGVTAREALESWEPVVYFSRTSLKLSDLSYLLWCTQGTRSIEGSDAPIRNVPSSGNRHPIDTYFVAGEIEDLPTGLYRYLPRTHQIVEICEGSDTPFTMGTASMDFKVVTRAAVTFLWVAVPYRSVWALGNRGYRSALLEAGHICQALIVASASIGCRVHPIDLFHDEMVSQLADLDDASQWPVYIAAVGKLEREL